MGVKDAREMKDAGPGWSRTKPRALPRGPRPLASLDRVGAWWTPCPPLHSQRRRCVHAPSPRAIAH
jgi:hypothetical protein